MHKLDKTAQVNVIEMTHRDSSLGGNWKFSDRSIWFPTRRKKPIWPISVTTNSIEALGTFDSFYRPERSFQFGTWLQIAYIIKVGILKYTHVFPRCDTNPKMNSRSAWLLRISFYFIFYHHIFTKEIFYNGRSQ